MDVAASEFLTDDGKYDLNFKNKPNDGSEVKTGCVACVWLCLLQCGSCRLCFVLAECCRVLQSGSLDYICTAL